MTPLATDEDVETRLGRDLTTAESERTPGLLDEASVMVLGHMRLSEDYYDEIAIPNTVTIVTSRMVKRVLDQDANSAPANAEQVTQSAGIFSQTFGFSQGSNTGSPWLTKQDRADLDNISGDNKSFAVDTAPSAQCVHDVACSIYFGGACSCGADIACEPLYGVE